MPLRLAYVSPTILAGITEALKVPGSMGQRDEIGTRGEAIFTAAIMNFCGRTRPFFITHFLGDKFRALDFIVELVGVRSTSPYLFVQVKTTRQGYTGSGGGKKLRVSVKREDVLRMRDYPAPTYLVGIDEVLEKAFIISIDERTQTSISGMTTRHELNARNLSILWYQVNGYWKRRDMKVRKSAFSI
jgi:hypothetical protein